MFVDIPTRMILNSLNVLDGSLSDSCWHFLFPKKKKKSCFAISIRNQLTVAHYWKCICARMRNGFLPTSSCHVYYVPLALFIPEWLASSQSWWPWSSTLLYGWSGLKITLRCTTFCLKHVPSLYTQHCQQELSGSMRHYFKDVARCMLRCMKKTFIGWVVG